MTNGDYIRSMSDEELAEMINAHWRCDNCPIQDCCNEDGMCYECAKEWLRKEIPIGVPRRRYE